MNFYGTLHGAFVNGLREILAHKMRSLLSMSGIILGVAALVAMVSIVQGMVGQFKGFIEMQGGIEKITISTESLPKEQEHLQDSAPGLTMTDVDAIRKLVPSVSHISPEVSVNFTTISRNGKEFLCRRLVIATGGLSYPGTGSTGDGYGWARQFRHNVRTCFPSLTAIVPEGYKDMSGAGQADSGSGLKGHIDRSVPLSETGSLLNGNQLKNVSLALYIDGACVQEEFGDMDFTDGGIEGSIGFKVSRRCVNAVMNGSKVSISIDLKPAVSADALDKRIRSLWQEIAEDRRSIGKSYNDRFRVLLGKLLPASLVQGFRRCNQGIDHKTLAARLKNWKMNIRGFVGYERCVITAGGISTDEINARKMESKLCPGLYFAGEIIDLDGDTGGYNLQTAFSTGMLAGQSAARSLILP